MNPMRIAAVVLRQFYLLRGSATRVIPLFVWVGIEIILWGFITKYLNGITQAGFNFVPAILGAVLLWGFLIRVMQGVTIAFFEDVWARNFLNMFASPLTIAEFLLGLIGSSIATSAVGLMVMLVLASGVFGLSLFSYGVMLIPFLLLLFLFGIALGIFGAAIVLRLGPSSEWFVWPIPALISPFVGVFYPLSTLPEWMQWVGHALPPAYVFEGVRAIAAGQTMPLQGLLQGFGLCLLYLAAAYLLFARTHRRAIRTGLIARYSAESVN